MISVLMGVHRLDAFVFPAIDSLLDQHNVELELILVANGHNYRSVSDAIREHYPNEERIRIYETPVGQLAHALNVGLSVAKYDLIARMDADDLAYPDRLSRQLAFINMTGSDMVGCALRLIDAHGKKIGFRLYPTGNAINRKLPFKNCFAHNTILAQKRILLDAGGYIGGFNSEDIDLWLRLRRKGVKWDNMTDALVDYRIHDAAAQRKILGYAEGLGYRLRELLLTKKPVFAIAILLGFFKIIIRAR